MHPKMTQLPGRPNNRDAASAPEGLVARQAARLLSEENCACCLGSSPASRRSQTPHLSNSSEVPEGAPELRLGVPFRRMRPFVEEPVWVLLRRTTPFREDSPPTAFPKVGSGPRWLCSVPKDSAPPSTVDHPEGISNDQVALNPRRDVVLPNQLVVPEGASGGRQSTKPEGLTFQRSQTLSEESVTPSSSTAPRGCFRRLCRSRYAAVRRRLCFAAMRWSALPK
jgi:hypothetical protein